MTDTDALANWVLQNNLDLGERVNLGDPTRNVPQPSAFAIAHAAYRRTIEQRKREDNVNEYPPALLRKPLSDQMRRSMIDAAANTNDKVLRAREECRHEAYHESTEAMRPAFREGKFDKMLDGSKVVECNEQQRDKSSYMEVQRPDYRPWDK